MQKNKSIPSPSGDPSSSGSLPAKPLSGNEGSKAELDKTEATRIIKKYPNRRLYDTETSAYITLAEVRRLVMDSTQFVVRDAKTNEDLTRSILLQIILEEEAGGAPMFTEAVLGNIIRFYGDAMQGFMGAYLEKNVQSFMDLQVEMAEQSKNVFTQMQEQMQKQSEQMLSALGLKR